jgi:SanA protein
VAIAVAVMVLAWGASAIAIYAISSGRVFYSARIDAVPRQRAAVVMGCVRTLPNGLNNLYFSRRIYAAAELYKAGKVDCLIVSGDNHVKGYDEPSDMKESLAKAGVPADRIVCDYAGFRTLDTVVRAKKVFGLDSFIIVSQPDHVRRAVFTARGFGCDAYGYAAKDVNGRYSIKTTIREQLAKIAVVADVVLRRRPKFLGPREPLPPPASEVSVYSQKNVSGVKVLPISCEQSQRGLAASDAKKGYGDDDGCAV